MQSISRLAALGILGATLAVANPASANLIVNGSFEQPDVPTNSWQYFDSSDVDGWDGSNIEIWDSYGSVNAADGTQFAELNAHPDSADGFGILQTFTTVANEWYDLSFAYRARANNDEVFEASVDGVSSWLMDDHVVGEWSVFSTAFQASGTETTLRFTSVAPDGTIGNFLDDVRVTAAAVPAPGTLALMGLGLVGLGLAARRRA